jgi:hypothetical protein
MAISDEYDQCNAGINHNGLQNSSMEIHFHFLTYIFIKYAVDVTLNVLLDLWIVSYHNDNLNVSKLGKINSTNQERFQIKLTRKTSGKFRCEPQDVHKNHPLDHLLSQLKAVHFFPF